MTPISWMQHAAAAIRREQAGSAGWRLSAPIVPARRVETFAELCARVGIDGAWPCTDACDAADPSNRGMSHTDCEHHVG